MRLLESEPGPDPLMFAKAIDALVDAGRAFGALMQMKVGVVVYFFVLLILLLSLGSGSISTCSSCSSHGPVEAEEGGRLQEVLAGREEESHRMEGATHLPPRITSRILLETKEPKGL